MKIFDDKYINIVMFRLLDGTANSTNNNDASSVNDEDNEFISIFMGQYHRNVDKPNRLEVSPYTKHYYYYYYYNYYNTTILLL